MEAAFTLAFILPEFTPSTIPVPGSSSATAVAPAQLVALSETSLALVGTLLVTTLSTPSAPTLTVLTSAPSTALGTVNETQAEVSTAFLAVGPSQGQGLITRLNTRESSGAEAVETEAETPVGVGQGRGQDAKGPAWIRFVIGVEEGMEQVRHESHEALLGAEKPATSEKSPRSEAEAPAGDGSPAPRSTPPRVPGQGRIDEGPSGAHLVVEAADEVIASIDAATHFWCAEQAEQPLAPAWAPVVLAATLVMHVGWSSPTNSSERRWAVPTLRWPGKNR
jgi:hypothetical protein